MDKLTFITEMAKALAWPVVVGIGLKMVGAELVMLLREITDLKIGNVEVKRKLKEANVNLAVAEAASDEALHPDLTVQSVQTTGYVTAPSPNKLLALSSPEIAVEMAWTRVEQALRQHGISPQEPYELRSERLHSITNPPTVIAIENLRSVRDSLVHESAVISGKAAMGYVDTADRIVNLLLRTPSKRFSTPPKSSP